MSLNFSFSRYRSAIPNKPRQNGSVFIVALFVIVVMGLLAGTMARLEWSNQDTLTREQLGTQAWLLANTGNEWALTQLFPLEKLEDSASVKERCSALNNANQDDVKEELQVNSCVIKEISCKNKGTGQLQYFKVETSTQCSLNSNGLYQVERAQQVVVKGLES